MNKATNKVEMKTTDVKNVLALTTTTPSNLCKYHLLIYHNAVRDFLKPELTKEFKTMCAVDNPVTNKLFGDDLDKQMRVE